MKLLKVTEVATILRVAKITVKRWVKSGNLQAYKHEKNKRYLFDSEVVEKFLTEEYKSGSLT